MKYLVQLSRDNRRHCDALVCALGDVSVTEREVGALYARYRRADHAGRARLVAEPHLFLNALREAEPEPDASPTHPPSPSGATAPDGRLSGSFAPSPRPLARCR